MASNLDMVSRLLDAKLEGRAVASDAAVTNAPPAASAPAPAAVKVVAEKSEKNRSPDRSKSRKKARTHRSRSRSRSRGRRHRSRSRSRSRSRDRDRRRRRSRHRSSSRERSRRRHRSESPSADAEFTKIAETAEEKAVRDMIRDACTVLVTQLPVRATSRDIATYFSQCGTVRDVRLVKDRGASVSKGFAYLEMETAEQATACLRLTGALFQGRSLLVQPTQNERNRAEEAKKAMLGTPTGVGGGAGGTGGGGGGGAGGSSKVYVGSLHFGVNEDALRAIFSPFGRVLEVVIHRETTGVSRGFGFVTFATAQEARRAINDLNGLEVLGRPIKVGEPKASGTELPGAESEDLAMGDRLDADDSLMLNSQTRALLMAKLQRGNEAVSAPIADQLQQSSVHIQPSRCVVLQNCFDAEREDATPDNHDWEQDIQADVRAECEGFGRVEHCKLERDSGCIYVKFDDIGSAIKAREALNGRFFGGQTIAVDFVTLTVYQKKYGKDN